MPGIARRIRDCGPIVGGKGGGVSRRELALRAVPRGALVAGCVIGALTALSCGDESRAPAADPSRQPSIEDGRPAAGTGLIEGSVLYSGDVPPAEELALDPADECSLLMESLRLEGSHELSPESWKSYSTWRSWPA